MAETITVKEHAGTVLSTSLQTLVNFNTGLLPGGAVVQGVQLVNSGASDHVVWVYHIPSGQVAAAAYLIGKTTVPANDTIPLQMGAPSYGASGSFVQAIEDAGTDVTARVSAFERTAA